MRTIPQAGRAQVATNVLAPETFEELLPVHSGPFAAEDVRTATMRIQQNLERASLSAQLRASTKATVELFCALARHAPEHLPGTWAFIYDMLAAEERFWVYPKLTLGDIEDGMGDAFTPYLSREKVAAEWEAILAHVQSVARAQESARRHALTA